MNYFERFRVSPGDRVRLKDIDADFTDGHESSKEAAGEIEQCQEQLRTLQELLYAERKQSLLICLQAMDTGGKDGTINHVLGAMNPQSCRVAPFVHRRTKSCRTIFSGGPTRRPRPTAKS